MFRLMRNIHLGLGLASVAMMLVFALSSLFVIYRPWLPDGTSDTEWTVSIAGDAAETPRALALELMRHHGLKGDLLGITETADGFRFRVYRPGTEDAVVYSRPTGAATIRHREWRLGQTLQQLHTTHAFWHGFAPANVWAALSLLASIALLLLGVSGIYLWFSHYKERTIGGALLVFGLGYGLISLLLTRLEF